MRQNLTVSSNLNYYIKKQAQFFNLLLIYKCIAFLLFLSKGSTVIPFIYFYQHYLYIIKLSIYFVF
jgi:hypothetical protein